MLIIKIQFKLEVFIFHVFSTYPPQIRKFAHAFRNAQTTADGGGVFIGE
jgi:hypothetical protein